MKNITRLFGMVSHLKWLMALLAFIAIFDAALNLAAPWVYRLIVNVVSDLVTQTLSQEEATAAVARAGLFIVAIFVATNAVYIIQRFYTVKLVVGVQKTLRERLFNHVAEMSVDYFEKEKAGKVMSKMNRGITKGTELLREASDWMLAQIVTGLLAIVILFILDPLAGLITVVASTVFIVTTFVLVKRINPLHEEINKKTDEISSHSLDVISGIHTVKAFTMEEKEKALFSKRNEEWANMEKRRAMIRTKYFVGRYTVLDFARAIVLILAGYRAINGQITPGDVFLYIMYLNYIVWPLSEITWFYDSAQEAMRSVDDMVAFLDTPPSVREKPGAKKLREVRGEIEFKDVSFSYLKEKNILKNISFKVDAGQVIALVGPSGTGKTTISKLLLRYYDVTSGSISVDGHDIRDVKQKSLRDNTGIVHQDIALFNDTIKNNITYGAKRYTLADIEEAAKAANIHDFIMGLPKKYDSLVGERGIKLSGGEKQRIAIARALLKNPPILILDEATSHLDSESEKLVQEAMWRLIQNRTTIIIAHRLATVMKADNILVIKEGQIVESGSHRELLDQKGMYARLFNIQSGAMLLEE